MNQQLRRLRGWLFGLVSVLSLACAEATAPQPEPDVQRSCTGTKCMVCYIYETNDVICAKEGDWDN